MRDDGLEERGIDDVRLRDLIETGETRYKNAVRLWIYKKYADRDDDLLCVAATLIGDVSFAADGTVVEVVILEARAHGAFPVKQQAA